jgi:predicted ester cyclase
MTAEKDTVERYLAALEAKDVGAAADLVSDDLEFATPVEPLDKETFMRFMSGLFEGFPDWRFDHGPIDEKGEIASTRLRMTGTHTGTLDLPLPGLKPVAPTGKKVVLPEQRFDYTVRDEKIVRIEAEPLPHAGIIGTLEQIGVRLPPLFVMKGIAKVARLFRRA